MDPLTHLLSGALVALAVEPARPRPGYVGRLPRVCAGAVAGLAPDFAHLARLGDPMAVLSPGGAWTHSLLLLPLLALLLAGLSAVLARRPDQWRAFLRVAVPALLVHLALDLMTATGIQPWYPVSDARYAVPLLFPVDPWVAALALMAAIIAWRRPALARRTALAAFAAGAGYLVLVAQWRDEALAAGAAAARSAAGAGTVHAFPQPFSPRNWQVLVAHEDALELAWIKVGGGAGPAAPGGAAGTAPAVAPVPAGPSAGEPQPPVSALAALRAAYAPPAQARWTQVFRFGDDGGRAEFARTAWSRPEFEAFRRFSVFTVLSHVEYRADVRQVCAWFYDARFALPSVAPSYRFGACQHMDERTWSMQRAPGPLPLL